VCVCTDLAARLSGCISGSTKTHLWSIDFFFWREGGCCCSL